jgi:GNAT superfamily N-acetyltransferase
VRAVSLGPEGLDAFVALGRTDRDGREIPPIEQVLLAELSGAVAFGRYGRQRLFLCEDGAGRALGRIVALIHPGVHDSTGVPIGQVGYFESPDDSAVARTLFDAALAWLGAQGCRSVMGPMNGGAHRLHRALVRGFDREPFLFEPRNPPHVPRLFEVCGFRVGHRWSTYELDAEQAGALEQRFGHILTARPAAGPIDLADPSAVEATLARLHGLLDGFWTGHVGYGGLSLKEFAEVFVGALAIMEPRSLPVLRARGRDVGCAFMYPDWAAQARAVAGDAGRWGQWPRTPLPERLVVHTLALLPEARGGSGGVALMHHALQLFRQDGYRYLLAALVIEGFLGRLLGEPTREYALYERAL